MKHYTSQNVLAVVEFNLKFTYVLVGWEGLALDAWILKDSLNRPDGIHLPEGKFYLGDACYACWPGILPLQENQVSSERVLFKEHTFSSRNSLEADSAIVVLNANATADNKSRSWAIYRNIAAARNVIPMCKVVKIGRNINRVAHDLDSLAKVSGLSNVWSQPIPAAIQIMAGHDCVIEPMSNI
jgi:hypothetical protein